MYWILGRKPELSLASKRQFYKAVLKPIWTYSIPLVGHSLSFTYQIPAKISE
jgi:O-antigen/teichoic acid export membrane protein